MHVRTWGWRIIPRIPRKTVNPLILRTKTCGGYPILSPAHPPHIPRRVPEAKGTVKTSTTHPSPYGDFEGIFDVADGDRGKPAVGPNCADILGDAEDRQPPSSATARMPSKRRQAPAAAGRAPGRPGGGAGGEGRDALGGVNPTCLNLRVLSACVQGERAFGKEPCSLQDPLGRSRSRGSAVSWQGRASSSSSRRRQGSL